MAAIRMDMSQVSTMALSCARRRCQTGEGEMPYDLVIRNGMVVDGTGFSRYRADVAVSDGTRRTSNNIRKQHMRASFF